MAIITDANLKTHLGHSGTQHDTIITNAVNAANQAVVQHLGRDPSEKIATGSETERLFYPENRCLVIADDIWDTTNLVVKTDEGDDGTYETTWTITTDFQLEPLNQLENGVTVPYYRIVAVESRFFPRNRRPSVQITAAWGWTAVPAAVFEATLIKAARLFHRKDSPQGVASFDEFGAVRLGSKDGDVMALLAPFRRSDQVLLVG